MCSEHVRLADKLSNYKTPASARDDHPDGPSIRADTGAPLSSSRLCAQRLIQNPAHVQEYFVRATKVTKHCSSVDPDLADELEAIYREGEFELGAIRRIRLERSHLARLSSTQ